ncbi:MAG: DeoR/GlpR transcriptional regulator [Clostridia bacterium]|nr:DeoR/GlpR transcriptional regulator [Clostridia bacterium]
MLTHERRKLILDYISENGSASVTRLSELLGASESTIRRDLAGLAELGKLNKVHGGATLVGQEYMNREDTINVKVQKNYEEKLAVAEYAAGLINDEDYVFLDAGSTTFLMTRFIVGSRATFVTNGVAQAHELARNGCRVMILGGELKDTTEAIIGSVAAANLQRYNFSKAFLGANGIALKQGYTTTDTAEAMIKAIAIEHSFVSYVVTDGSKFGRVSAVTVAPVDTCCIICDRCDKDEIKRKTVVKEVSKEDGLHDNS